MQNNTLTVRTGYLPGFVGTAVQTFTPIPEVYYNVIVDGRVVLTGWEVTLEDAEAAIYDYYFDILNGVRPFPFHPGV